MSHLHHADKTQVANPGPDVHLVDGGSHVSEGF